MNPFETFRDVPATSADVFAAITSPARLARWWGPAGFTNEFAVCDVQPGGRWSFTMIGPDGNRYANESTFEAIEPPRRVVIRHANEPKFRLTIALDATPGGTRVSWSQRFDDDEVARKVAPIVVPANEQNLDRLAAEVLKMSAPR